MARIPIPDIQNAPGLADPVLTSTPNMRVNMQGAIRDLTTPQINPDAFNGTGQGLQGIGNSLHRAGDVISDWNTRMLRIRDDDAELQASKIFHSTQAEVTKQMQSAPVDQWGDIVQAAVENAKPMIDALPASDGVKARIQDQTNYGFGTFINHVASSAQAKSTANLRQDFINTAMTAADNGDLNLVDSTMALLAKSDVKPGDFSSLADQLTQKAQKALINKATMQDPKGTLAQLDIAA
ncbi:MAG: hypothetical protein ABIP97_13920, partial [Chthoniobacterales bacterium]